jgi:hypothetical protein
MTTAIAARGKAGGAVFVRFSETNEWEGETWQFYIPLAGNEKALEDLRTKLADADLQDQDGEGDGERVFTLEADPLPEVEVDVLVANGADDGYMPEHTKLTGTLVLPESSGVELGQALYKGGIRNLVQATPAAAQMPSLPDTTIPDTSQKDAHGR